ncbi:MAG: branched-chain amino acid ABC transporter permease, partial [Cohaesibacteraceae bacterium]|nr:branched-chain amino acid ABC transporter permease [Cohaesibacteraceae bacterium]
MHGTSALKDWLIMAVFSAVVLTAPFTLVYIGAGYPDILQKFAIYG